MRQIGNAVAVCVADFVGREIGDVIRREQGAAVPARPAPQFWSPALDRPVQAVLSTESAHATRHPLALQTQALSSVPPCLAVSGTPDTWCVRRVEPDSAIWMTRPMQPMHEEESLPLPNLARRGRIPSQFRPEWRQPYRGLLTTANAISRRLCQDLRESRAPQGVLVA